MLSPAISTPGLMYWETPPAIKANDKKMEVEQISK